MDMATSTIAEGQIEGGRVPKENPWSQDCLLTPWERLAPIQPPSTTAIPPALCCPWLGTRALRSPCSPSYLPERWAEGVVAVPDQKQIANGWFAIFMDPARFSGQAHYDVESSRFYDWVKTSRLRQGFSEVLMPGEPEARALADREKHGIPIDDSTWGKIASIADEARIELPAFPLILS